jgi:putative peptidoglycan lipid II flippase
MVSGIWQKRPLLSASIVLSVALLAGRVSGLFRDLLIGAKLGISETADLAVVLLTIPDLFVNLLLAGGLSAALVPRFRQLKASESHELLHQLIIWVLVAFGLIGLVVAFMPEAVFAVIAPGTLQYNDLVPRAALFLMAATIPLTAMLGVTTAFLNANTRFFLPGLGTLIFNLCIIAVMLLGAASFGQLQLLAAGMALGALLRLTTQAGMISWSPRSLSITKGPADRALAKAFATSVIAATIALIVPLVVRAAASLIGPGVIASFNYAQKLIELPVGILITTISTVALTKLSGHYGAGDHDSAQLDATTALAQALSLAWPVTIFGVVFMYPVVSLLFQRGALDAAAAAHIADLARIAILGVPFVAVSSMATADLNAQRRTTTVLRITALSALLIPLVAVPALLLSSQGILMASVVSFQFVLAVGLAKAAGPHYGLGGGIHLLRNAKVIIVSGVMCAIVFGVLKAVGPVGNIVELLAAGVGFAMSVAVTRRFA